jgi:hypothetical protein
MAIEHCLEGRGHGQNETEEEYEKSRPREPVLNPRNETEYLQNKVRGVTETPANSMLKISRIGYNNNMR